MEKVLSIGEIMEDCFYKYVDKYGIDLDSQKSANRIEAVFMDMYEELFKPSPDDKVLNGAKSKIKYNDVKTVEEVLRTYIRLCMMSNTIPKVTSFSSLTGIHRSSIFFWSKCNTTNNNIFKLSSVQIAEESEELRKAFLFAESNQVVNANMTEEQKVLSSYRLDISKIIKENSQKFTRNTLQMSPMGALAVANNDVEVGLMWDARRQLTAATIEQNKATLGAQELPKLTDNM